MVLKKYSNVEEVTVVETDEENSKSGAWERVSELESATREESSKAQEQ